VISGQSPAVALHEMTHRMEDTLPRLPEVERQFYARRTKGEQLKRLGPGHVKNELGRKDDFVNVYMGKDYRKAYGKDTPF
jgi:hypothetical protein